MIITLRAHHGLCKEFFQGKGYSEEFTENMARVINDLESRNCKVRLVTKCDAVCLKCPHNTCGSCASGQKTARFDRKVLELTGLCEGDVISHESFAKLIRREIIEAGRLREVCGDCQWYQEICSDAGRKKLTSRQISP